MSVTEVGKFLRKLRIDNGEILKDMADRLEMSAAYLSSIENGRRLIPADLYDKMKQYCLSEDEKAILSRAIADTNKYVKLELSEKEGRLRQNDAAFVFARKFSKMDETTAEKIISLLSK